jgi:hypothetical protein
MAESIEEALGALASLLHGDPPSGSFSWEQVMPLVRRHSLSPFLYWCLQNRWPSSVSVPPAVSNHLRDEYYLAHSQCMLRDRELPQVVTALDNAGISGLLFKGAALAHSVYPDPALRTMGDMDVLIRETQVESARQALEELGYECRPEIPQRFNPFNTQFTGELGFRRALGRTSVLVDVHWALFTIELIRQTMAIDLEALWTSALPIEIEGVTAFRLALEDQLMHVCLHLSMHGFTHLVGYVDILQIVDTGQIDWDVFIRCVRQRRLCVACYFPLWWARRAWNANVPVWVLEALEPNRLRTRLGRWMLVRGIWREPDTGHAWNHSAQLLIVDRFSGLARALLWLLFPGPAWLQERYRLHSPWHAWLWVTVHPTLVLWEGLRSIGALLREITEQK